MFKAVDPTSAAELSGSAWGVSLQDVSDSNPNPMNRTQGKRMIGIPKGRAVEVVQQLCRLQLRMNEIYARCNRDSLARVSDLEKAWNFEAG